MIRLFAFLFIFGLYPLSAQSLSQLRQEVQQIVQNKNAVVGVYLLDKNGEPLVSINAEHHLPMQSVYKFHIALALLAEVDKGRFSLEQPIQITSKDLEGDTYSPIRDEFPNGTTLPLSKIISYTVSQSDNVGCDKMIALLGGADQVDSYFKNNGFSDIAIKHTEAVQQSAWHLQFDNWTTAKASSELLKRFYENKPPYLSESSYHFIWKTMRETSTGGNRLKGELPEGTVVAHKTGTSGRKEGVRAAINDMGIIFLPNGDPVYLTVFVSASTEDDDTNEKIIAEIAKATWDYFSND